MIGFLKTLETVDEDRVIVKLFRGYVPLDSHHVAAMVNMAWDGSGVVRMREVCFLLLVPGTQQAHCFNVC